MLASLSCSRMGNGSVQGMSAPPNSSDSRNRSRAIDQQLREEKNALENTIKMMLLGPGNSGKSTILKQMRIIHHKEFSKDELRAIRHLIFANIIESFQLIVDYMHQNQLEFELQDCQQDAKMVEDAVSNLSALSTIQPLVDALKRLWTDPELQSCVQKGSTFNLNESLKYYMGHLDRIAHTAYLPNHEDVLYARAPTAGVIEVQFKIDNRIFRVIDVGGQRTERRKWIHHFEDVQSVIFIAAISEFDQLMEEDGKTNRIHDAINLFGDIANNPFFKSASQILFLNKKDLFEEKIQHTPLTVAFPRYNGPNTYDEGIKFLRNLFEEKKKRMDTTLYCHVTCATDTKQIQFVLDSCIHTIINNNIRGMGIN